MLIRERRLADVRKDVAWMLAMNAEQAHEMNSLMKIFDHSCSSSSSRYEMAAVVFFIGSN